jgi:hypothetical protein
MKTGLFSFFRFRSHYIDPWLLASAVPQLLIYSPFGGGTLVFFISIGIWLVFGRHASARLIDWQVMWPSLALGTYALLSFLISGIGTAGCFQRMPGHVYILLFPFMSAGLVLIPNPIKWMSLGAKIALFYWSIISLYPAFFSTERLGFGTNPANAVYVFMACGCLCRFDRKPSGYIFFYMSILPSIATGTRVALIFYAPVIIYDKFTLSSNFMKNKIQSKIKNIIFLIGIAFICTTVSQSAMIQSRVNDTVKEITDIFSGQGVGSIRVRSVILKAGFETFASAPLAGAGLCQSVKNISAETAIIDPNARYYFFHNMAVDVLAYFGLGGFVLFCWWCIAVARSVLTGDRKNLAPGFILLLMVFVYGLTGSFLDHDRLIGITFLIFAALISERQRMLLWAKIRASGISVAR